ncbi:MAG: hypothetical protein K9L82_16995 [Chromatiaceae bacterium]|nr:hypothetical protein [Chromatiaceae bacterium]MCF7993858.1 hypothetical protein [Chromatiaceae bacterium]MCF8003878.1 hypothetical protein [Chromatiaceae bacterium]MCF8017151.1 hypothetical protein [Chromatiaceae bacterium]
MSAEIELFDCPRHAGNLRLTATTCAQMWKRGKTAAKWDRLETCKGCKIGAEHAGEPIKEEGGDRCIWCGKTQYSRRLAHKLFCVSCWNRMVECAKGRFRRDKPPAQMSIMRIYEVEVFDNDETSACEIPPRSDSHCCTADRKAGQCCA